MKTHLILSRIIPALALLFGSVPQLLAQSFSLDRLAIAGGAGTSAGGVYSATFTIGQPLASAGMSASEPSFGSGFWSPYMAATASGAQTLAVSPGYDFTSSGVVGGPFSYFRETYVVNNSGGNSVNWSVSHSANWLTVPYSGTLAPGSATGLGFSINANANSLPVGTYTDTVVFSNATTGVAFATRTITLTVTTGLSVSTDYLFASGTVGGPFTPNSATYTLRNLAATPLDWTASIAANWVGLSQPGGTLAPGATTTLTVSLNANANTLGPGNYSDNLSFVNTTDGRGNQLRGVNLTVAPGLIVTRGGGVFSFASGPEGGPFTPDHFDCVLSNQTSTALTWTSGFASNWISLSATGGTLAAGASTTVRMAFNANANTLLGGNYWETVTFLNAAHPADQSALSIGLNVLDSPPVITAQPLHQTVAPGANLTFSVSSTGSSLRYQWYHDGVSIPGATNRTLTLPRVTPADAGHYRVEVSNSQYLTTSSDGTLALFSLNYANGPVLTLAARLLDFYRIEYQDDLAATNWTTLSRFNVPFNGVYSLADTNAPSAKRFYRAVYGP